MSRLVLADRFPAAVITPDGSRVPGLCRAALTADDLYVWSDDGGVHLAHEHHLAQLADTPRRRPWSITTDAGVFRIARDTAAGCGCSSRLRRLTTQMLWRGDT